MTSSRLWGRYGTLPISSGSFGDHLPAFVKEVDGIQEIYVAYIPQWSSIDNSIEDKIISCIGTIEDSVVKDSSVFDSAVQLEVEGVDNIQINDGELVYIMGSQLYADINLVCRDLFDNLFKGQRIYHTKDDCYLFCANYKFGLQVDEYGHKSYFSPIFQRAMKVFDAELSLQRLNNRTSAALNLMGWFKQSPVEIESWVIRNVATAILKGDRDGYMVKITLGATKLKCSVDELGQLVRLWLEADKSCYFGKLKSED